MPIFYLKDEQSGKLVPLPGGWTLEDFDRLSAQAQQQTQPDQTPAYTIQSISATGEAKKDHAELTVTFSIRLRDGDWARVPLRLDQAVLLPGQDQGDRSGDHFLDLDAQGHGYVVWIKDPPRKQYRLTLNVWVPLNRVGDQTQLRLSLPRAATSKLALTVPLAKAVGEVSEGATLMPPVPSQSGGTRFTAMGLAGDFQLSWRPAQSGRLQVRPMLDAEGTIVAQLGRRSVTTMAKLKVTPHGAPFNRFAVRLPKGAELIHDVPTGYAVWERPAAKDAQEETVVEVQRAEKLLAPMEVQLSVRQMEDASGPGGAFELGGFEVIDAHRQWGYLAVTAVGDWHVRCNPGRGVRRIEQLPENLQKELQNENVLAGFEYFSQPFSLSARVMEIQPSIRVEPQYYILVRDKQAELDARLKYTIRGAEVAALYVALPGWQVEKDQVGPENMVDIDALAVDRSGRLLIPLLQPSKGAVEITLRAHQAIQPGGGRLSLALPRPQADSLRPAEVVIQPADNVTLVPRAEASAGLVRQQVAPPPQIERADWQQMPLYYRAETAKAAFVAQITVHAQQVSVEVTSQVNLLDQQAAVRQTLAYSIAYQPLEKLALQVPAAVAQSRGWEILLDGQPLSAIADQSGLNGASGPRRYWVVLPSARIGKCKLELRYVVETQGLSSAPAGRCTIPLVMPDDSGPVRLSTNELLVTAPDGVSLQPSEGRWKAAQGLAGRLGQPAAWRFSATGRTSQVVLCIKRKQPGATVVERAWIQTWLSSTGRRDRAVFRLITQRRQLELVLPAEADLGRVQLFLGGENPQERRRVIPAATPEGRLVLALPASSSGRPLWLEALYDVPGRRRASGRLRVELPRLAGDLFVGRTYWQLVLPANEHVIAGPEGFTPEFRWGWNGSFWGRIPLLEQAQLEAWSGARRLAPVPEGTSRYLFTSSGPISRCELRVASRWLIVLAASLAVLAAGLLLIYVPALRHPAGLLVAATALLAAGLIYPQPALLALEAASLGLALALLAGLLHRALARERHWVVRPAVSSSLLHKGSTQAQYRPPLAGGPASTEAASAGASVPSSGSNP